MSSANDRSTLAGMLVMAASAMLLVAGWRLMWFQCDDAYIAFRYISNRQLGWGYTWNPPPFLPVEGYTSFLWVALLDGIWTFLGIPPDLAATRLGLIAGFGSIGIVGWMVWRAPWSPSFMPWRPAWLAIVMLGTLTNRTFLTWTSSGLEAPLFNMLLLAWVAVGAAPRRGPGWSFSLMGVGTLLTLCRPDGLLFLAFGFLVVAAGRRGRMGRDDLLGALPVGLVVAHVLWRRWTYGYWLPNTWYAKDVGWWPTAGLDYLGLFVLDNAWWLWVPVLVMAARPTRWLRAEGLAARVVVVALVAHVSYYVLRIGGDHFEFRVLSHLPPLLWWALVRALDVAEFAPGRAFVLSHTIVPLSGAVAWVDWAQMLHVTGYDEIKQLRRPLAPRAPWPVSAYLSLHDRLENNLVAHSIASPWQTHKWFAEHKRLGFDDRDVVMERFPVTVWAEEAQGDKAFPIVTLSSVGVAGWRLPTVAVLDRLGLNDLVIARTPVPPGRFRRMAHARQPPPGYLDCFAPNIDAIGRLEIEPRSTPMSVDQIRFCERTWLDRAEAGELGPKPDEVTVDLPDDDAAPGPSAVPAPAEAP